MIFEKLIVFTRYPEPGQAKTRLIPVLGKTGAANLHRLMAQKAIARALSLQTSRRLSVEIHHTGGSQQQMQDWLGTDIIYQNQIDGDLGAKMTAAFQQSFNSGIDKAAIIGTDCPDLKAEIMAQAFDKLSQHDLVLGPAKDGGYYLIGLRRSIPELFAGINWGTSEVFAATQAIAQNLNLNIAYLPTLVDIDIPEDLLGLDINIVK
ncbi:MAG: TIGR04282 family arsenosugar biosynthesis glycosyltransferase [Microcoleus sp. PH2017_10_PVI_O_A]|uniref:TIGR04282 family arsenosugar biosynthesis glycosyltransferase n=1 Tax=unclassified Microcoleus TaxID=2642155 RepID=UPI001D2A43BA|nr:MULTISPECIES: TIGR04282 family arsenosugar biosynthesis glycosyltransferase [unclassified Microcoleus]MCC3405052.1 TIGR04282 family arsenosugar biosynthesis glycosyltransferase [Microcoleus sp. PH2017_10_PVI_O_A]MCC3459133.1 TIGR04282 family arsenosugar biosynthesis glycosyltransferase [Microcoleus sp. PH2017_11_PCY_U_A]MCC3477190.1 TIGR04282 family arsenosugar biosynthesis glycosyltransferase [Microcoleus sp. PH2017_12_PCY_D_A]MCC3558363.1 TIGR04282 family arsenosugar biosynthesis glycosylt